MKYLYLARHGESTPSEIDPNQPLSKIGFTQTEQIAHLLKGFHLKIDTIFHSTKQRAKQTAEIYAKQFKSDLFEKEGLKPLDPISPIQEEISYESNNLMLVGHLPFMEKLLTALLFNEERISPFDFAASSVICLAGEGREWKINWALSPKIFA